MTRPRTNPRAITVEEVLAEVDASADDDHSIGRKEAVRIVIAAQHSINGVGFPAMTPGHPLHFDPDEL